MEGERGLAGAGRGFGEWLPPTISPGLSSLKRKVWSSLKVSSNL